MVGWCNGSTREWDVMPFDSAPRGDEAKVVAEKPTRREVRILNHRSNNYLWSGCIHAPSELGRYW